VKTSICHDERESVCELIWIATPHGRALLRRPAESRETTLRVGPLELDLLERTAKRGDRVIDLLPREFRLLEYMIRRKEQVLTRTMLLEEVGTTSSFRKPTLSTCIWVGCGTKWTVRMRRP